jgi:hypothetical protein
MNSEAVMSKAKLVAKIIIIIGGLFLSVACSVAIFFLLAISSTGTVGYIEEFWNVGYAGIVLIMITFLAGAIRFSFNEKSGFSLFLLFCSPLIGAATIPIMFMAASN